MKKIGPTSSRCVWGLNFYRLQVRQLYKDLQLGPDSTFSGGYLMNREHVGMPLRRALEDVFITLTEPAVLVVDFSDVEEMTGSVAEEVGPKLFGAVETNRKVNPGKYLIYDSLTPEVRKELDAWFGKYGLCVPAFLHHGRDDHMPIIGTLPPDNLLEALTFLYRNGPITSSVLKRELKAAEKKLADVYRSYPWLLHRTKEKGDSPRSWRYVLTPLVSIDRSLHLDGQETGTS